MSGATTPNKEAVIPEFKQIMGHPSPLWMLFMTEFWERFAFYGVRWALVLYIVAQFHGGDGSGQAAANLTYGSFLALVYAGALFGGYIADRVIGYQRSILLGAVFMAAGLFCISVPNQDIFNLGLATMIVGNGMFKPNISTMVGKLYTTADPRRDSGFTIFYMGINMGAMAAPVFTQWLAESIFGTSDMPSYKMVFMASGFGMLISLVWFFIGRRALKGIGAPEAGAGNPMRVVWVAVGSLCVIPLMYFLLTVGAEKLQIVLTVLFVGLAVMLMIEGIRNGKVARDRVIAMLLIFVFNILFWMFFEQAGSSFTFLADKIVNRDLGFCDLPDRLLPDRQFGGHHRLRAYHRRRLGLPGAPQRQSIDPAQIRPGIAGQCIGFRLADLRSVEPGWRRQQDPVLDAGDRVHAAIDRRTVPVAYRPVDGHQAGACAPGWPGHGRLVPVDRYRQQPVGYLRQLRQRRKRHVGAVGPVRLYLRLLVPAGRRCRPVPDRTADQQTDARREVSVLY